MSWPTSSPTIPTSWAASPPPKRWASRAAPKAIEALAAAVRNDAFWGAQAEAAKALGATRSTAARDALINLGDIPHPKARRGVVQALGEFRHDERAADALLPAVRGDASYFVEGSATISLSKTRSPRAYDAIAAQFDKPSYNETLRVMACNALAELKEERAIDFLLGWTPYGPPPAGAFRRYRRASRPGRPFPRPQDARCGAAD